MTFDEAMTAYRAAEAVLAADHTDANVAAFWAARDDLRAAAVALRESTQNQEGLT